MLGCGSGGVATINCIFPLMTNIIYWLLFFSGAVALVIIILSGIRFIVSGGESKSVETAKKSMTYAVFGLLLVFLAFLIINVIAFVTGVACIKGAADGSSVSLIAPFQTCEGGVSGGSGGGGWGSSGGPGGGSSYPPCEPTYKCVTNDNECSYRTGNSKNIIGGRECGDPSQACCDLTGRTASGGGATCNGLTNYSCETSQANCLTNHGSPDASLSCTLGGAGGAAGFCCIHH
jgi:hypothetical protein